MFQNQNANPNSSSNPMASTSQPMVNNKTNAAGLLPEISKALPTRQPEADELIVLKALQGLYTSQVSEETLEVFSDQVIFTLPTGEVAVGKRGIATKLHEMCSAFPSRTFSQNLLTLPPSTNLPPRTMAIDQFVKIFSGEGEGELVAEIQSLLVIKRSAKDGKVLSISEEEGHRKATVPLAARAAAAANFYSPTDNMVSPTTSKLNLAKKKHHMKGKPTSLFGSPSSTSGTPSASSARQPSRLASSTMDDDMSF